MEGDNTQWEHQQELLKNFNSASYLQANPDVASNSYYGSRALQHYLDAGAAEGRSGSGIDWGAPTPQAPPPAAVGTGPGGGGDPQSSISAPTTPPPTGAVDPNAQYNYGQGTQGGADSEGNVIPASYNQGQYNYQEGLPADFDPYQYMKNNPDVLASGMDPGRHYMLYGKNEGRNWSGGANVAYIDPTRNANITLDPTTGKYVYHQVDEHSLDQYNVKPEDLTLKGTAMRAVQGQGLGEFTYVKGGEGVAPPPPRMGSSGEYVNPDAIDIKYVDPKTADPTKPWYLTGEGEGRYSWSQDQPVLDDNNSGTFFGNMLGGGRQGASIASTIARAVPALVATIASYGTASPMIVGAVGGAAAGSQLGGRQSTIGDVLKNMGVGAATGAVGGYAAPYIGEALSGVGNNLGLTGEGGIIPSAWNAVEGAIGSGSTIDPTTGLSIGSTPSGGLVPPPSGETLTPPPSMEGGLSPTGPPNAPVSPYGPGESLTGEGTLTPPPERPVWPEGLNPTPGGGESLYGEGLAAPPDTNIDTNANEGGEPYSVDENGNAVRGQNIDRGIDMNEGSGAPYSVDSEGNTLSGPPSDNPADYDPIGGLDIGSILANVGGYAKYIPAIISLLTAAGILGKGGTSPTAVSGTPHGGGNTGTSPSELGSLLASYGSAGGGGTPVSSGPGDSAAGGGGFGKGLEAMLAQLKNEEMQKQGNYYFQVGK